MSFFSREMIWSEWQLLKQLILIFFNLLLESKTQTSDLIQYEREVKKIGNRFTNIAKNNLVCKIFGIRFVAA